MTTPNWLLYNKATFPKQRVLPDATIEPLRIRKFRILPRSRPRFDELVPARDGVHGGSGPLH